MNVLLIDPPGWQKHGLNLGLAYLAGSLRAADIQVKILDMNNHVYSDEGLRRIVGAYKPGVVGISIKTATANISVEIVRKLKNMFPDLIYAAGGPHVTLCGKEFVQENKEIDYGIMGEGEVSFVQLVKNISDGNKNAAHIKGICYRENGNVISGATNEKPDISKLPFPVFDCIRDMDFGEFRYPMLTSRGCPHGCIFCCASLIAGKKWRAREPQHVVNELLYAKENYQTTSFEIMDDNFTLDTARAKKICRLIIKKKLHMDWWCHNGLRADRLDKELVHLMKKAGCTSIALGIESGDKDVFDNINKGEELQDIVQAVKMIKRAGMKCVGYFIVGLPGDSIESTKRTVKFQRSLKLADYKYNILIPYPGTKMWEIVNAKGRLLTDIKGTYHFGGNLEIPFETDSISKEVLERCMYLAENQAWVSGEHDLRNLNKSFIERFGGRIKRVVCIETDSAPVGKHIEIEFGGVDVLKVTQARSWDKVQRKHVLEHDRGGRYFDALFRLQGEGYQIVLDISKKTLLMHRASKTDNEYVMNEKLPSFPEWDGSSGKYFTASLKNKTPDIQSAGNGVIYKDGIALPFSSHPQWEKNPCGKIESGLAFISNAAGSPHATYTVDYVATKCESDLCELILHDDENSSMERLMSESDVLFCPEGSGAFTLLASRAKINALYHCNGKGIDSLEYEALDQFSIGRKNYIMNQIGIISIIWGSRMAIVRKLLHFSGKCGTVLLLWSQIAAYMVVVNLRNLISRIVRF